MGNCLGTGEEIANYIYQLRCKCINRDETIREESDLSPAEFHVINTLNVDDKMSGAVFANKVDLSPSRSSRVIDRMVQKGFLVVERNSSDKRGITVSLAEDGFRLKEQIGKAREHCNQKIEEVLPKEERIEVSETLKKIVELL